MLKKDFRILVADDDALVRDAIKDLLVRQGYSVCTARDGLEAIRLLALDEMSLVVTDLRMPGAGGIDVLRQTLRTDPDAAVIIMTAYGSLEDALEATRQGAFDYLMKPFQIEQMVLAAEKAYRRAVLIAENRELRTRLREAYRDLELAKAEDSAGGDNTRDARLVSDQRGRELQVLTTDGTMGTKRRMTEGHGKS